MKNMKKIIALLIAVLTVFNSLNTISAAGPSSGASTGNVRYLNIEAPSGTKTVYSYHYQADISGTITGSGRIAIPTTVTVTLKITPPTGQEISSVSGATSLGNGRYSVKVDHGKWVTVKTSKIAYTITLKKDGSTYKTLTKYYGDTLGTLPTPAKSGYNFKGWYTATSGGTKVSSSTKVTGNKTYYAQWTKKVSNDTAYEVTLNANGGSFSGDETQSYDVAKNGTFSFSGKTPTRTNYTLLGWSTSNNAETAQYGKNGSVTVSKNITYYAVWEHNGGGNTGDEDAEISVNTEGKLYGFADMSYIDPIYSFGTMRWSETSEIKIYSLDDFTIVLQDRLSESTWTNTPGSYMGGKLLPTSDTKLGANLKTGTEAGIGTVSTTVTGNTSLKPKIPANKKMYLTNGLVAVGSYQDYIKIKNGGVGAVNVVFGNHLDSGKTSSTNILLTNVGIDIAGDPFDVLFEFEATEGPGWEYNYGTGGDITSATDESIGSTRIGHIVMGNITFSSNNGAVVMWLNAHCCAVEVKAHYFKAGTCNGTASSGTRAVIEGTAISLSDIDANNSNKNRSTNLYGRFDPDYNESSTSVFVALHSDEGIAFRAADIDRTKLFTKLGEAANLTKISSSLSQWKNKTGSSVNSKNIYGYQMNDGAPFAIATAGHSGDVSDGIGLLSNTTATIVQSLTSSRKYLQFVYGYGLAAGIFFQFGSPYSYGSLNVDTSKSENSSVKAAEKIPSIKNNTAEFTPSGATKTIKYTEYIYIPYQNHSSNLAVIRGLNASQSDKAYTSITVKHQLLAEEEGNKIDADQIASLVQNGHVTSVTLEDITTTSSDPERGVLTCASTANIAEDGTFSFVLSGIDENDYGRIYKITYNLNLLTGEEQYLLGLDKIKNSFILETSNISRTGTKIVYGASDEVATDINWQTNYELNVNVTKTNSNVFAKKVSWNGSLSSAVSGISLRLTPNSFADKNFNVTFASTSDVRRLGSIPVDGIASKVGNASITFDYDITEDHFAFANGVGTYSETLNFNMITYSLNGGSYVSANNYTSIVYSPDLGHSVALLDETDVQREGYRLIGWADSVTGEVYNLTDVITEGDHNLTAQWEEIIYEVTYDENLPSGIESPAENMPDNQSFGYNGHVFIATEIPTIGYYTFDSWNTEQDGSGETYHGGDRYEENENLVLYAQWIANTLTIRYHSNGATSDEKNSEYLFSNDPMLTVSYSYGVSYPKLTSGLEKYNGGRWQLRKTGYKYADENFWGIRGTENKIDARTGWASVDALATALNTDIEHGNVVVDLDALWSGITLTVVYELDNGQVGTLPENQTVEYGTNFSFGSAEEIEKTGYHFESLTDDVWTDGTDYYDTNVVYNADVSFDPRLAYEDVTITVHPVMVPNRYVIIYLPNGANEDSVMNPNSQTVTYDETGSIYENQYVKTYFDFVCWNTEPDGSGITYTENQTFKNLRSEDGAVIYLYAQWRVDNDKTLNILVTEGVLLGTNIGEQEIDLENKSEFEVQVDTITVEVNSRWEQVDYDTWEEQNIGLGTRKFAVKFGELPLLEIDGSGRITVNSKVPNNVPEQLSGHFIVEVSPNY